MSIRVKVIFLVCLCSIVISGCARSSHMLKKEVGGEKIHDTFVVKPGGSYEECIELKPGVVFDYYYDSSDFVNFNIHYHTEEGIKFPVKEKGRMGGKGTIDPGQHEYHTEDQEAYCLMWDNVNDEKVEISFECVLKEKSGP